ncbi:acyl-CoA N-acyltransferase [Halteromyces radiatus]|uniref:acyl-CoA N-acyltransferase n=1 Tax=Halteromyces radiatus TaxID=101107 RepID=UPI0022206F18|nr:acyl-CoA N-acyltransferase [Halteromyces radiatus]KAI8081334.1 acyl-CoA N-acyltransferase [Halteromyces radiatus]
MNIKIVQPDSTYAQILSDLGRRLFSESFADYNLPDDLNSYLDDAYTPKHQLQELNNPSMHTYMAFDEDNIPIAFCQLRENKNVYDFINDPEAIELQRIYVDKRYARQGIGKKLLAECILKARQLGKETIWLGVWEHNPSGIKFYQKEGFFKVGSHAFRMGNKVDDDHIMIKKI